MLTLIGNWTIDYGLPDETLLRDHLQNDIKKISFNSQGLDQWDSLLLIFLVRLKKLCLSRNIILELDQLPKGARKLLVLAAKVPRHEEPQQPKSLPFVTRTGEIFIEAFHKGGELSKFTGEIILECTVLFRGRIPFKMRDFFYFVQSTGAEALPIVTLISVLVGIILAFVGAVQLKMFGAQIYVANLVGLAMVLEMGAMMTGIIMAGRTGAAYAAQLGTMQVNEEIDALQTLGISPIGFLVLPRMFALMLMMPLLCIYADILGILGGSFIGIFMLDLSFTEYFLHTQKAIKLDQCMQGLVKSCIYGVLVGYAGCLRGLQCGRSASAVGEATTSAVVTAIVLIIVSDAMMTFIFNL